MKTWYGGPEYLENVITKVTMLFAVLVSNIPTVVIWLSKKNRSPVSLLLSQIAICDTLTILTGSIWSIVAYVIGQLHYGNDCYFLVFIGSLPTVFHTLSVTSTTFLAVERFIICISPFVGPKICKTKAFVIQTVVFSVTTIVWKLPLTLIRKVTGHRDLRSDNTTLFHCDVEYVLEDNRMKEYFPIDAIIRLFLIGVVPVAIITFCMIGCLITVNRKPVGNSQQRNARRTTVMLVMVMFIFMAGKVPSIFMNLFKFLKMKVWINSKPGIFFCNMILVFSFMVNIWVYIAMSKQFRNDMKKLLCCNKGNNSSQLMVSSKRITSKPMVFTDISQSNSSQLSVDHTTSSSQLSVDHEISTTNSSQLSIIREISQNNSLR